MYTILNPPIPTSPSSIRLELQVRRVLPPSFLHCSPQRAKLCTEKQLRHRQFVGVARSRYSSRESHCITESCRVQSSEYCASVFFGSSPWLFDWDTLLELNFPWKPYDGGLPSSRLRSKQPSSIRKLARYMEKVKSPVSNPIGITERKREKLKPHNKTEYLSLN